MLYIPQDVNQYPDETTKYQLIFFFFRMELKVFHAASLKCLLKTLRNQWTLMFNLFRLI